MLPEAFGLRMVPERPKELVLHVGLPTILGVHGLDSFKVMQELPRYCQLARVRTGGVRVDAECP